MYSNFIASCAEIDNDKKIDMIEERISSIIDLIESFKQEYIYNVNRSVQKEIRHDKTSRITTYDSKQKTKNSISNSMTSETNISNTYNQTFIQTRPLSNSTLLCSDNFKSSKTPQKSNSMIYSNIDTSKLTATQPKQKRKFDYVMNHYQKMNKQDTMKYIKAKNKNKKTLKNIKQKYGNKNFFYTKDHVIQFSKCTPKDDISTVEFSKKNNLTNRSSLNCISKQLRGSCVKIQGIQIKNFKNLIKSPEHSTTYKCKSDRNEHSHKRDKFLW